MTSIEREEFGAAFGEQVHRYTLDNGNGIIARFLTFGGVIQSLHLPGKDGPLVNVVLGHGSVDEYLHSPAYFGCITGRYANRISKGTFEIDGQRFQLAINDPPDSLHGGRRGFNQYAWQADASMTTAGPALRLVHFSPDGDEGFPGALNVAVTYTLTTNNALEVEYQATTNKPTICNLTQHTYWNLGGEGSGSIEDHELQLNASQITLVGGSLIPTGELADVTGTPFDFRIAKPIGRDIRQATGQIIAGKGYDHNFVFDRPEAAPGLFAAGSLQHPASGRTMTLSTTEPGVQVYTGNFLDGSGAGISGRVYRQGDAVALETQHYPDSPNNPHFPSTVLRPDENYASKTVFGFSW